MYKLIPLLDSLGVNDDGIVEYGDTFDADIRSAYADDISLAESAVLDLKAQVATLVSEIVSLKAALYDKIESAGVEDDAAEDDPDDENDDDDATGVDRLFGKAE